MAGAKPESSNAVVRSGLFFQEAWEELKKVHAPTRQETIRATVGVLLMVLVFAFFLGLTDWVVGLAIRHVIAS